MCLHSLEKKNLLFLKLHIKLYIIHQPLELVQINVKWCSSIKHPLVLHKSLSTALISSLWTSQNPSCSIPTVPFVQDISNRKWSKYKWGLQRGLRRKASCYYITRDAHPLGKFLMVMVTATQRARCGRHPRCIWEIE